MHYQIFFPKASEPNDNLFAENGIGNLVRGNTAPIEWAEVKNHGPGDGYGMLATWREQDKVKSGDAPPLRIEDGWLWSPAKANAELELPAERFYFGTNPLAPPTPDDLALHRDHCFPGVDIILADNSYWVIPSVNKLPCQIGLNSEGKVEKKIAKQHEWYVKKAWEIATPVFDQLDALDWLMQMTDKELDESEESVTLELSDVWEFVVTALMMNYRVNQEVIDFLALLEGKHILAITMAAIDLPDITRVRDQKKTQSTVEIPVS